MIETAAKQRNYSTDNCKLLISITKGSFKSACISYIPTTPTIPNTCTKQSYNYAITINEQKWNGMGLKP